MCVYRLIVSIVTNSPPVLAPTSDLARRLSTILEGLCRAIEEEMSGKWYFWPMVLMLRPQLRWTRAAFASLVEQLDRLAASLPSDLTTTPWS